MASAGGGGQRRGANEEAPLDMRGPMAAVTYALVSICIMLFNKAVLTEYGFTYPKVLTLCQSTATFVMMRLLGHFQVISFDEIDTEKLKAVAPLSFLFLAYVLISLSALGNVNMPMFAALRRTTVVFVMIAEFYLLQRTPSMRVKGATAVMVLGALIAASNDITMDTLSFVLIFSTNFSGAMYSVFISRVRDRAKLDVLTLLYYNTVITTPFLFVYVAMSGELSAAMQFEHAGDIVFQIMFVASMFLAFLLNWTTFRNTTINSPMTQTVTGQAKNFIAFLLSLVLFSDYKYNNVNFFGLTVGFGGGVLYAVAKVLDKRDASASRSDGGNSNSKV